MPEFLARIDKVAPTKLRNINLFLALFILLPHLAAYLFAKPGEIGDGVTSWAFLVSLDVVAAIVLVGCLLTFYDGDRLASVLRQQSYVLCLAAALTLLWGIALAVSGGPNVSFSFNPVLFALFCSYPVYLLRRFVFADKLRSSWGLAYAHIFTAVIALTIGGLVIVNSFVDGF